MRRKHLLITALAAACFAAAWVAPPAAAGEAGSPGELTSGGRRIPLLTIFGSATGPKFDRREAPAYPFAAKKRGQEGTVVLRLSIDAYGDLQAAEVVEATDPVFVEPALASLKKSSFVPAKNNGRPVYSQAVLPIHFKLKK